ncbi:MAG: ATP-binding protein [Muribaculaceae bacterium]|nr:ATP-binding protein [Roseburia sp.]MCM1429807.1 ATP-binding protein [Muribaculaceae bacterium]MCM1492858.1 ATP-binding protein [Muribaculaceae bacterium]
MKEKTVEKFGALRDGQVIQAINYTGICLFRYFPREHRIVNEIKTCRVYDCEEVYQDAPQSFIMEKVYEADQKAAMALYARIDAGAEGGSEDFRIRKASGPWCRVTLTVTERDNIGRPLEAVGLVQDISAEKIHEKALVNALLMANQDKNERMESVLAGIQGGFKISLDDEGFSFDYCSGEAAAIQGYTVEELLESCGGSVLANVYEPDRESCRKALLSQYAVGDTYSVKYRVRHKDGRLLWIMDSGRKVTQKDGGIRHYGLLRDVTEETQASEQLHATVQAFQIAADVTGDIVFMFDAVKQEIYATASVADQFGLLDVQTGVPYETAESGIVAKDSKAEYIRLHEEIMHGAKEADGIVNLISANGETGVYELRFRAILGVDGKPCGKAVGVYKDITQHYLQAQKQKRSLQDLKEEYNKKNLRVKAENRRQMEAIYALSMDYYAIFHINLQENTFLPLRQEVNYPESIIGQETYEEFFKSYCRQMIQSEDLIIMQKYADREYLADKLEKKLFIAHEYRTVTRSWRRGRFVVESRDASGRARTVLFGVQIIDDEKRRELDYQEELKRAYEGANRANVAKTRFLSNMSHDIRTPMNSIIGFASIAAGHPEDVESVKDCLDKILNSSEHLLGLINDILDMSRIESGKTVLEVSRTSLSELVQSIQALIEPQAQGKQLKFHVDAGDIEDTHVYADALKIRQILINILGNAVKFTPTGGEVSLRVQQKPAEKSGRGRYCFTVKDTGIGMSEEFQKHIFEPFERERTTTVSGIAGTGLGMTITKSLVDMMEGTLAVESTLGEGSEFTVEIELKLQEDVPEDKKNAEPKEEQQEKFTGFSGNRILVVEDYELNREIARALLSGVGLVVETANDGVDALDILKKSEPGYYQLVLMDVQMPVMNGYEATREIRHLEREDLRNIPIVAMTANAFAEDVAAAAAEGMNDHLSKPLDMKKVVSTLHKYLH